MGSVVSKWVHLVRCTIWNVLHPREVHVPLPYSFLGLSGARGQGRVASRSRAQASLLHIGSFF